MGIPIRENIVLAPFTTLKIGGKARFFISAATAEQVASGCAFASERDLAVFVLGGGSNILVADSGFPGLVLQAALTGTKRVEANGKVFVTAGAGEDWDEFVGACVASDLQGLECLSGIPGFVGGTPVQNVGAYGQEVSETITEVTVFDRVDRGIRKLDNKDCGFAYRSSVFNTVARERYIVLSVTFALAQNGPPRIVYKDLVEHFGSHSPSLAEVREAVIGIRRAKSMVIDPRDPNSKSAGSFFKNPVITEEQFSPLTERARRLGLENVPSFQAGEGRVKIPAAWLIEKAGFNKGFVLGNAGLSTRHTLAVINRGSASAGEIIALKNEIQEKVREIFGLDLLTEPVFVGFDP